MPSAVRVQHQRPSCVKEVIALEVGEVSSRTIPTETKCCLTPSSGLLSLKKDSVASVCTDASLIHSKWGMEIKVDYILQTDGWNTNVDQEPDACCEVSLRPHSHKT